MADNRDWTRDELLVCFNFYCRTPFGKFHRNNPDVIQLAEALNRTPSAVAMKLGNFASFDPAHQSRNVKGLANASRLDRAVWEEFNTNPNLLAQQSEEAYGRLELPSAVPAEVEFAMPTGPTEATATRPMRLVQSFLSQERAGGVQILLCLLPNRHTGSALSKAHHPLARKHRTARRRSTLNTRT